MRRVIEQDELFQICTQVQPKPESRLESGELESGELESGELESGELESREPGLREPGLREPGSREPKLREEVGRIQQERVAEQSDEAPGLCKKQGIGKKQGVGKKQSLSRLLKHPKLWRAGHLEQAQSRSGISTGFQNLDALLPDHGWPCGGLTELMMPMAGVGELRLLIPAVRDLSQQDNRWIAWINPPFIPYGPALDDLGVNLDRILLIRPRSHRDALWAYERACRSGSCSAVLGWLDDAKLRLKDTQRLQIAAKQGCSWSVLFRRFTTDASMAELRLCIHPQRRHQSRKHGTRKHGRREHEKDTLQTLHLEILKRRGGWPVDHLELKLTEATNTERISHRSVREKLELWRGTCDSSVIRTRVSDVPPTPQSSENEVRVH